MSLALSLIATPSLTFNSGWHFLHAKTYPLWNSSSKCSFLISFIGGKIFNQCICFWYGDTSESILKKQMAGGIAHTIRESLVFAGHTHGSEYITHKGQCHGILKQKPEPQVGERIFMLSEKHFSSRGWFYLWSNLSCHYLGHLLLNLLSNFDKNLKKM